MRFFFPKKKHRKKSSATNHENQLNGGLFRSKKMSIFQFGFLLGKWWVNPYWNCIFGLVVHVFVGIVLQ